MEKHKDNSEDQRLAALRQQRWEKREADRKAAIAPIIQELNDIGAKISSLSDYVANRNVSSKEADVLLKWLTVTKSIDVQCAIISTLTQTQEDFDGQVLADLFEKARDFHDDHLREIIANTIAFGKVAGLTDWTIKTITNPKYGRRRDLLCYAIAKMLPREQAIDILKSVFDELPSSLDVLGKIGKDPSIIEFLKSKQQEISHKLDSGRQLTIKQKKNLESSRQHIEKTIRKIEKRIAKEQGKPIPKYGPPTPSNVKSGRPNRIFSAVIGLVKPAVKQSETGANFDLENVPLFLKRIAPFIAKGFGKQQVDYIANLIDELELHEQRDITFQIVFEGHSCELGMHIFLDDIDAPDINFMGPKSLICKIEAEMDKLADELEI